MPRTVPLRRLKERFAWTSLVESPCSANSSAHQARAKKPRSSSRRSRSITYAPRSSVSVKITGLAYARGPPAKLGIEVAAVDQQPEVLQPDVPVALELLS